MKPYINFRNKKTKQSFERITEKTAEWIELFEWIPERIGNFQSQQACRDVQQ